MRLVVVSDSHGAWGNLFEAISREASADAVYFLGDGYREYEELLCAHSDKFFFIGVRGNCDFSCFGDVVKQIFGVGKQSTL